MNIKFDKEILTAILEVDINILDIEDKKNIAIKYNLLEKDEFHITLIGSKTGEKILKSMENFNAAKKDEIIKTINLYLAETNWEITLENEFYYIEKEYLENEEKETRKSIIQKVKMSNLENFYNLLNNLLRSDFKIPFPHITLFTNSTRIDKKLRGIGIYAEDDFNDLIKKKLED